MQVSCNKAINTSVFSWFFPFWDPLVNWKGRSILNISYVQNGLSARRGLPAQNHDPDKPHMVMQWLRVSDSRGWESTKYPNAEPHGTGTMNFSYIGPSSGSPEKLRISLILLLPEGILEDFQALRPPEKFVCIFSCVQIGKAVIQWYTSACNYSIALWFPILQAGIVVKDQTPAWGQIKDVCCQRSCPPEMEGKKNATCTLCLYSEQVKPHNSTAP